MDVGDLTEYGLPAPAEGMFARGKRLGRAPVIVDREVIHASRARVFEVVPTIDRFYGSSALLIDRRVLEPDAVICATGYVRGLEPMVGHLGVLNERGVPKSIGVDAAAPGVRFIGFLSRPGLTRSSPNSLSTSPSTSPTNSSVRRFQRPEEPCAAEDRKDGMCCMA